MTPTPFEEMQIVRLKADQRGENPYTGELVSQKAGDKGVIIVTGSHHCDVEFVTPAGLVTILIVPTDLLEAAA
jgi:hypothetical protein